MGMPFPYVSEHSARRLQSQHFVESRLRGGVVATVLGRARLFVGDLEEAPHDYFSVVASVAQENSTGLPRNGSFRDHSNLRQRRAQDSDGPVSRRPSYLHATVPTLSYGGSLPGAVTRTTLEG